MTSWEKQNSWWLNGRSPRAHIKVEIVSLIKIMCETFSRLLMEFPFARAFARKAPWHVFINYRTIELHKVHTSCEPGQLIISNFNDARLWASSTMLETVLSWCFMKSFSLWIMIDNAAINYESTEKTQSEQSQTMRQYARSLWIHEKLLTIQCVNVILYSHNFS